MSFSSPESRFPRVLSRKTPIISMSCLATGISISTFPLNGFAISPRCINACVLRLITNVEKLISGNFPGAAGSSVFRSACDVFSPDGCSESPRGSPVSGEKRRRSSTLKPLPSCPSLSSAMKFPAIRVERKNARRNHPRLGERATRHPMKIGHRLIGHSAEARNPFLHRGMGAEKTQEGSSRQRTHDKHVSGLGPRFERDHLARTGELRQGGRQTKRISRYLRPGGVGQELSRPRNGHLNHHRRYRRQYRHQNHSEDSPSPLFVPIAPADPEDGRPARHVGKHHHHPGERGSNSSNENIAVLDVRKLMGDHPFQLLPVHDP